MWNQGETMVDYGGGGGGGFMSQSGSPSLSQGGRKSVGGGGGGGERLQNIVPVSLACVAQSTPEEPLRVGGVEVKLAVVVGRVVSVDRSPVKITYTLTEHDAQQHGTEGVSVMAVRWLNAEGEADGGDGGDQLDCDVAEGMLCRVVVNVRPSRAPSAAAAPSAATAVRCFDIRPVSAEEMALHRLEVQHAELKIRHVESLLSGGAGSVSTNGAAAAGAGGSGGLTNSLSMVDTPMVHSGGMAGLTSAQQLVYSVIQAANSDDGASRDTIVAGVRGRVPRAEVEQVLEFLSNEGHVYNTTDDDHFKATDC